MDLAGRAVGRELQHNVRRNNPRQNGKNRGQDLAQHHAPWLQELLPAEGEQLLRELSAASRRTLDLNDALELRVLPARVGEHELRVTFDHREQIVEVVRDAS